MYFPEDMTFQYFFFDTYIGYFLQVIPVALIAGIIYFIYKLQHKNGLSTGKIAVKSLFVCYIAGLLSLTLFIDIIGSIYYFIFYHQFSLSDIPWFKFSCNFIPNFFKNFNGEKLWNILAFVPFGILYPLYNEKTTLKHTLIMAPVLSLCIEITQPIFGRATDINDIILNALGAQISTIIFYGVLNTVKHKNK